MKGETDGGVGAALGTPWALRLLGPQEPTFMKQEWGPFCVALSRGAVGLMVMISQCPARTCVAHCPPHLHRMLSDVQSALVDRGESVPDSTAMHEFPRSRVLCIHGRPSHFALPRSGFALSRFLNIE